MLRCAIPLLALHFVSQNQKSVNLARGHLRGILNPQPPSHKELLNQRETVARDKRLRTFVCLRVLPSPNQPRFNKFFNRQKTAPSLRLQAVLPATIAIPPGPVRRLSIGNGEVERDDQFFLSFSLNPHSDFTAASASTNNSSGPRSNNDSGVAGWPSSSSPLISSSPHKR